MSELKLTQAPGWVQPARGSDCHLRPPSYPPEADSSCGGCPGSAKLSLEQEAITLPGAGHSFCLEIYLQ